MLEQIINQKDSQCSHCASEIVKGERCSVNEYDEIICENCHEQERDEFKEEV